MNRLTSFLALLGFALPALGDQLSLPNPLVTAKGKPVTTAKQWTQQRRPEILELFRENIYGRVPVQRPEHLRFKTTTSEAMEGKAIRRLVDIEFAGRGGTGTIHAVMFIPKQQSAQPVPCFLMICNRSMENLDPDRISKTAFWPAEQIVNRGYATIGFLVSDVDPDFHDGFTNGVHALFDVPGRRTPDAWGTIAAWAWGASRVMDYLVSDPLIDPDRVAVIGHSRGGKTALWAGAEDQRFAYVISNSSGSTGAAVARGKGGEHISDINKHFPHWFNENYKKFNNRENELPVDQHMLAALIAPRLLYIQSSSADAWADPKHEFLSVVLVEPVYGLFGLKGLGTTRMPEPDAPIHGGAVAYHIRTGKHDLNEQDWQWYMDFADRHLRGWSKPSQGR